MVAIMLFAGAHATLTTLTLSKISKTVMIDHIGIAFGIVEVMDATGNFCGHTLYGYLYELTGNYHTSMNLLFYSCLVATFATFILSFKELGRFCWKLQFNDVNH